MSHDVMGDGQWDRCLSHINAVVLCEIGTCPTSCLTCYGLLFLFEFFFCFQ